ncbi:ABC transporter substrate-binding protein [Rathayibacter sp. Leaf296]|uniref:ABC transporter substrate-binding protein n=1 Tax=Rathayibacter sp. Leaf296 TaxID=1736327 RepID=UPI00070343F7|nr:extracellular solute-binding protein [Rathayibacter sp. Leaf296]KQQ08235.1 hypothetical protein ASF46_12955 [Rathayibacter sp. Leaf296]
MRITTPRRRTTSAGILTLAAATALALTGCSGSDSNTSAATEQCPDGVTTLDVLRAATQVPTDEQLSAYSDSVDGCVEFAVNEVPFGQLDAKINVLASSSNVPDIIGFDSPSMTDYASKGLLLPLDEYVSAEWKENALPATLKADTYDGKLYAADVQQDALSLYFNKDLTDAAGITVPTTLGEAWTWEEAREAMLACQQGTPGDPSIYGLAPTQLGDGTPGNVYADLLILRSAGDPTADESSSAYKTYAALSPDGTSVDGYLNSPEAIEAATFFQSLFNGDEAVSSKTGRPNAFIDGKACFDLFPSAQTAALTDADFEWGNSPMPYITTPIIHTGAVTIGATAATTTPEIAGKVVAALSESSMATEYTTANGRLPALTDVAADNAQYQEAPYDMLFEELQQWGEPRPLTPAFGQYNTIVATALKNIAYGSDARTQLDQAVDQLDPILAR